MRMRINCTALCTETTTKTVQIDIEPITSTVDYTVALQDYSGNSTVSSP